MKKEPIVYFPTSSEDLENREAMVGQLLKIGKPCLRTFEHVHHNMNYGAHRLEYLQGLLKLEGVTVQIISILKMNSGVRMAVLCKKDRKNFSENIEKLFANIDEALKTKELLFY